jgi:hypothetical protein
MKTGTLSLVVALAASLVVAWAVATPTDVNAATIVGAQWTPGSGCEPCNGNFTLYCNNGVVNGQPVNDCGGGSFSNCGLTGSATGNCQPTGQHPCSGANWYCNLESQTCP